MVHSTKISKQLQTLVGYLQEKEKQMATVNHICTKSFGECSPHSK